MNSDGSQPQEVISARQVAPDQPIADLLPAGWSSDGQRVLVWIDPDFSSSIAAGGLDLMSVSVNGGVVHRLGNTFVYIDALAVSDRNPGIVFVAGGHRMSWTDKHLFLADPRSGVVTPLGDAKSAVISPVWSPDGSHIAYVSGPDDPLAVGGAELTPRAGERPGGRR